ncbi:MAG TPA: redoxin domain-containing protein [Kofleriaceae bacterium]|nr:redoxin domain-containing protein [Kofleriaceae bacterium]
MDTPQTPDTTQAPSHSPPAGKAPTAPLAVGQKAPEFELRSTPDQRVALSSLLGQPVVLVFYPADWSPVCSDQLALYNQLCDEWQKHRARLLGISVDNTWCHIAYAKDRRLRFPLLSDFEPKGEVARRYGAYDAEQGTAARALFVLDRDGTIAWSYRSPIGVNPGADGILEALEALGTRKERAHG